MRKIILLFLFLLSTPFLLSTSSSLHQLITGNALVSTRVIVLGQCYFTLYEGWNLVSLCGNETDYNVSALVEQIDGKYRYLMKWDNEGEKFLVYSPRASIPEFDTIKKGEGFFVLMNEGGNLFYDRTLLES